MLTTDQRHFSTKRYDFYSSVLHYVTQKGYEGCQWQEWLYFYISASCSLVSDFIFINWQANSNISFY